MLRFLKLASASIFMALIAFSFNLKAEDLNRFMGIMHPPLPEEIEKRAGWLVDDDYSVTLGSINAQEVLLLNLTIGQDSQGKALFQVVDVLPLPAIDDERESVLGGSPHFCYVNAKYDPTLVVIAQLEDGNTEFLTRIRQAWRVDLKAEKFTEIEVEGVEFRCDNLGFGL